MPIASSCPWPSEACLREQDFCRSLWLKRSERELRGRTSQERRRGSATTAMKCCPRASEVCGMVGAVRRRCAGRWELCGTVVLVVGEDEGWPEMVKLAEKSEKMSLHNEEIGVF
ncbi:hypothetical protein DEO72_LG6g764 [Vigna unguiculata]|uniref:Uncharacterized protein n=1 Tax=Vigna unguiculata TaxID=3917 RepID=A0A4D6M482_VIGUN|nr:hypothetical protein DEO72_LG6g764 [Vigna unguiculata]